MADPSGLIRNETPPVRGALAVIGIGGRVCLGRVMKVVIIEDDSFTTDNVKLALRLRWPDAELLTCPSGKDGVEMARNQAPNLVIVESALPDMSGLEVLDQIRRDSTVPILMLSSFRDEAEAVRSLEHGADEFMTKPVGQMELLARVNNLTRRRH
jgi:DNA-binding response OmpR family regulator